MHLDLWPLQLAAFSAIAVVPQHRRWVFYNTFEAIMLLKLALISPSSSWVLPFSSYCIPSSSCARGALVYVVLATSLVFLLFLHFPPLPHTASLPHSNRPRSPPLLYIRLCAEHTFERCTYICIIGHGPTLRHKGIGLGDTNRGTEGRCAWATALHMRQSDWGEQHTARQQRSSPFTPFTITFPSH